MVPTLFFVDPAHMLVHKPGADALTDALADPLACARTDALIDANKEDYTTAAMATFGSLPAGKAVAPRSVFRMVQGVHMLQLFSPSLIRSHPVSSGLIQSHPVASSLIQSHRVSSGLIQSHPVSSSLIPSHLVASSLI